MGPAALVLALVGLALALRWPYLWLIPRFTDETLEVLHSVSIARGEQFPLTNYDSYYGALFNYLLAVPFALFGPDPTLPRLVVVLLSALTLVPAYLLGAQLGGRPAGALSALLLAVNGAHVVVNSHIAWSNCLTPLFTTTGFWLIQRASAAGGGTSLAVAGLVFGLALQTHPAAVAFLPALAVFVLWKCSGWRHVGWIALAGIMFAVGYANMIVYNLLTGFESLRSAERISLEYAQAEDVDAPAAAYGAMFVLFTRAIAGMVDQRDGSSGYLLDPAAILSLVLGAVGMALLARRGDPLPLLAIVAYLLVLPLVNTKFRTLVTVRYLMPVLPLFAACVSVALVELGRWWSRSGIGPGAVAPVVLTLVLTGSSLASMRHYYDRAIRNSDTNERIFHLSSIIQAQRRAGEPVLVDDGLGTELPDTGVTEIRGFRYLLTLAGVPHRVAPLTSRRVEDELQAEPSLLLVVNARDAEQVERRVRLQPLEDRPRAQVGRASDYQVYRVER